MKRLAGLHARFSMMLALGSAAMLTVACGDVGQEQLGETEPGPAAVDNDQGPVGEDNGEKQPGEEGPDGPVDDPDQPPNQQPNPTPPEGQPIDTPVEDNPVDDGPIDDEPVEDPVEDPIEDPVEDPVSDPVEDAPFTVMLVHGFMGFEDIGPIEGFAGVTEHLESLGTEDQPVEVYAPALPPIAGTSARAAVLAEEVDYALGETGATKIHLICHSQGGLDCRALVSELGYSHKVAAIVTVGTPHHGTPLADMAGLAPEGMLNPAGLFFAALLGLADEPPTQEDWDADEFVESVNAADVDGAIAAMNGEGAAQFNAANPDHPDVPVFSVAGVSRGSDGGALCDTGTLFGPVESTDRLFLPLILPGLAIAATADLEGNTSLAGRDNDGIVPTDSMVWGTFLGCVGADHFDEIGQAPNLLGTGFDHLAMYETLLGHLQSL